MEFKGTALVTGAGSGIGQALALLFAQRGCQNITLADIRMESIEETAEKIRNIAPNIKLFEVVVDVANEQSIQDMVSGTAEKFGGIDYATNVAGISPVSRQGVAEYPVEVYDHVMDVNARGVMMCTKMELQVMLRQPLSGRQRGSIVNVASITGFHGLPSMLGYVASKHCVLGITRTAALDYARQNVRVNAVCPGYIATPMIEKSPSAELTLTSAIPMGRLGVAEEAAEICAFLNSERSSFVTGAAYVVDGGGQAGYGWHQEM